MATTRKRRGAAEARQEILDAAERRLIARGPAGLRLQELAAEVGVSHPAILHHFGSREALVAAVVTRAVHSLQEDLITAIAGGPSSNGDAALLDRVFRTLSTRGHARFMAWLLLAGRDPLEGEDIRRAWRSIIDATHAARLTLRIDPPPSRQDTAFTVMLSALAMFGQALGGPTLFQAGGLGRSPRTQVEFRTWLAELLGVHLSGGRA